MWDLSIKMEAIFFLSVLNKTLFTIPLPTAPTIADPANMTPDETTQSKLYKKRLDAVVKRESTLDDNVQRLYSLVLEQCTNLLQSKLKQQTDWKTVSDAQNGITLITMIKKAVHKFEDQKIVPLAHYNAKAAIYAFCQGNLTNDKYLKISTILLTFIAPTKANYMTDHCLILW